MRSFHKNFQVLSVALAGIGNTPAGLHTSEDCSGGNAQGHCFSARI